MTAHHGSLQACRQGSSDPGRMHIGSGIRPVLPCQFKTRRKCGTAGALWSTQVQHINSKAASPQTNVLGPPAALQDFHNRGRVMPVPRAAPQLLRGASSPHRSQRGRGR